MVSTHDLNPTSLMYFKYWDTLKDKHPKLQLSVAVVPIWHRNVRNDVKSSVQFQEWYNSRDDWVHIFQQGCYNEKVPECLRFEKTQRKLIKRGFKKVHMYMPKDVYGFTAPFFRMNNHTIVVLKQLGYSYVVYHNQMLYLKSVEKEVPQFEIIQTYTNIEQERKNNINNIYEELDIQLTELETIKKYTSFNKLAKEVLG